MRITTKKFIFLCACACAQTHMHTRWRALTQTQTTNGCKHIPLSLSHTHSGQHTRKLTHTHTRTHTHARTRARTHTHTLKHGYMYVQTNVQSNEMLHICTVSLRSAACWGSPVMFCCPHVYLGSPTVVLLPYETLCLQGCPVMWRESQSSPVMCRWSWSPASPSILLLHVKAVPLRTAKAGAVALSAASFLGIVLSGQSHHVMLK